MKDALNPPLTEYLLYLLKEPRTRKDAGQESVRLGIRRDMAKFYWENVRLP